MHFIVPLSAHCKKKKKKEEGNLEGNFFLILKCFKFIFSMLEKYNIIYIKSNRYRGIMVEDVSIVM